MNTKSVDPEESKKLVNRLSVADARKVLRLEGGETGPVEFAVQVILVLGVYTLIARAIRVGDADALHLFLPLLTQLLALHLFLPVLYLAIRVKGIGKEALACLRNLAVLAAVLAAAIAWRANQHQIDWQQQFASDQSILLSWIVDHEMHWPMAGAAFLMLMGMSSRMRCFKMHGPPFASISMGCAIKLLLLFAGIFVLPLVWSNGAMLTWILWGALLSAEILGLIVMWDIQRRLQLIDSKRIRNT